MSSDHYYLEDPPSYLQQGDVLAGVPIVLPSQHRELLILRAAHYQRPLPHLQPGPIEITREAALNDAFESVDEYIAVGVRRVHAVIMSATCDLENISTWAVWPLNRIEGADVDEVALSQGKYVNLFRLPDHRNFPPAFIDFSSISVVARGATGLGDRVAVISREGQDELMDRFAESIGRHWGNASGTDVPPLGRYQTGKYRCARCNLYDIPPNEQTLGPGATFPLCENCSKINKAAQWYPLTKHRKS